MKKVINASTATAKQPFYGRTMAHIMETITEIADSVARPIIGNYVANDLVILYGCILTGNFSGAGNPFAVTAGAVYYNGEIYQVDAVSGTISGANVLVGTIVTTYQSGDPVTMSDNSTVSVHEIRKVVITQAASGSGTKNYSLWKPVLRINGRTTLATQNNATTVYADATGLTFTTPNDGKTRKLCIQLKGHFHLVGTHVGGGGEAKIFNLTTSTDLDSGYSFWQLDGAINFAQMRQAFTASFIGDVAPNNTIKVQFKSLSASFGIDLVQAVYEHFEL
jgi:hypothetical protein